MDTPIKQVCGVCNDEWLTEDEYLNHVCTVTGANPQQAEHLVKSTTPDFLEVQSQALQNGLSTLQAEQATTEQVTAQAEAIVAHAQANDLPVPEDLPVAADAVALDTPAEPEAPAISLG